MDSTEEIDMAEFADMEIEIKQSEPIALIDSAVRLVEIFSGRPSTISGEPSLMKCELDFYHSALAFLQMQYESERTFLYHKNPK